MRSSGGTTTDQIAQLVDVETVVAGRQTLNQNRHVSRFCARRLVKGDISLDSSIGDRENGDSFNWLHRLIGEEDTQEMN